ncbi:MAG: diaminopimelate epimerase [Bacteroidota bacterium]
MKIPFVKYQGAGNDFVIVDEMGDFPAGVEWSVEQITQLCDRRFGVGADGLIRLKSHSAYDFEMVYYNADGGASTLCGNGGRCIVAYAHHLGYCAQQTTFLDIDGPHRAYVSRAGWVELEMGTITEIQTVLEGYFLDTGSPHYVQWVTDLAELDVPTRGAAIRYAATFAPHGTNVNFVTGSLAQLHLRTYERGVEAETLACGTGVTAAALVAIAQSGQKGDFKVPVQAQGGALVVRTEYDGQHFTNTWLCGPAEQVFTGMIEI